MAVTKYSYGALLMVLLIVIRETLAYDRSFCEARSTALYQDPADCGAYYNCDRHKTFHFQCPPGLLFKQDAQQCDWSINVNCIVDSHDEQETTTTRVTPETDTHRTGINFCQSRASGLHVDPNDCRKYYNCANGATFHQSCGELFLFNPESKYCDWPHNVHCVSEQPATDAQPTTSESTPSSSKLTPKTSPTLTTIKDTNPSSKCRRIVCYFTNWSQYRRGAGKYRTDNIDPNICTHIIYAFAKLDGNLLVPTEQNDEDTSWSTGNYELIMRHKNTNPDLKVLLAVGGWNMGSPQFTAMVSTPENREEFIDTTVFFLRYRNFDGLDLDWEYPAHRGSPPGDRRRFAQLCRELRAAFEMDGKENYRTPLLLTAAVAAGKSIIEAAYDVPVLNDVLDFINIMAYDFHGGWDPVTGHNSPLYMGPWEEGTDNAFKNVKSAIDTLISLGADARNLVVGLPLYGRSFRLANPDDDGVNKAALGGGTRGQYTQEAGYLAYYEVCIMRIDSATQTFLIKEQSVPYLVNQDQWVGYDDRDSIREKVRYIRDNGLGGAMTWDISLDDFTGTFCSEGINPILNTIKDECYH